MYASVSTVNTRARGIGFWWLVALLSFCGVVLDRRYLSIPQVSWGIGIKYHTVTSIIKHSYETVEELHRTPAGPDRQPCL
jgi:Na+-transporting NADH:ubiquinone oxidoreductase subunit NqrE